MRIIALVFLAVISGAQSELTSSSVDETGPGGCPAPSPDPYTGSDIPWALTPRFFYLPLASQFSYRYFFEIFKGRSAKDLAELNSMRIKFAFLAGTNPVYAFNKLLPAYVLTCQPRKTLELVGNLNVYQALNVDCSATVGPPGTNTGLTARTLNTVLWTDNKSAILINRCSITSSGQQHYDWFVASVNSTISDEVRATILEKVAGFGWDPSLAQTLTY